MSSLGINPYANFAQTRTSGATNLAGNDDAAKQKNGLAEGVSEFREVLQAAERQAIDTAVTGADPHAMVQALANAELVLDTALTVRDKVVEAYQELLRMPV